MPPPVRTLVHGTSAVAWRAQALLYVAILRIALRFVPLRRTGRAMERLARLRLPPAPAAPRRARAALDAASALVPGGHDCFVRALALRALLAHRGFESDVHVGFRRDADGRVQGHAWLERQGRVLVGAVPDLEHFRAHGTPYRLEAHPSPHEGGFTS